MRVLDVPAVLVDGVTLLEKLVDHERVHVRQLIFFEAHKAAVDHVRLLHDRREHIVAIVAGAEAHFP